MTKVKLNNQKVQLLYDTCVIHVELTTCYLFCTQPILAYIKTYTNFELAKNHKPGKGVFRLISI